MCIHRFAICPLHTGGGGDAGRSLQVLEVLEAALEVVEADQVVIQVVVVVPVATAIISM